MTRRILLTGAHGFLGRHLRARLEGSGDELLCPTRSELDLLDFHATKAFFTKRAVTHAIHAAGFVGGIGLNEAHPGRMATENLRMGLNVLEGASQGGKAHVTIVSTICVYPEKAPVPIAESSVYEGYPAPATAPYGLAKRELLSVAEALSRESDLTFAYVIPTNLYGPGDHFDEAKSHVVPALIRRAIEARRNEVKEIVVWGDGTATRDLLFVTDAARAIGETLDRGHGRPINIGSGREISIRELAETICELTGYGGQLVWDKTKPAGAPRRTLDTTLARELIGFSPEVDIRDGLRRTIAWYTGTQPP